MDHGGDRPHGPPAGDPARAERAVLDPSALQDLVELFDGDPHVTRDFVGGYLDLIGPRRHRLDEAVRLLEPEEAVVALLSLHNASAMVGARQVARRCSRMLDLVQQTRWDEVREELPGLTADTRTAAEALAAWAP